MLFRVSPLFHWYCLCADLTLSSDKLKELLQPMDLKMVDVIVDRLDLPMSEVDKINENYHNPTQRKEAYLDLYVHQHPCPRWENVALLLSYLNLKEQADLVENTYVTGM